MFDKSLLFLAHTPLHSVTYSSLHSEAPAVEQPTTKEESVDVDEDEDEYEEDEEDEEEYHYVYEDEEADKEADKEDNEKQESSRMSQDEEKTLQEVKGSHWTCFKPHYV